jgi:formate/nitrite transporter FocA (FNT family)
MEIGSLFNTFKSAILAGICIALGGAVFLKAGGIIGAVLFSFGLLTVVHYKLKLYTGTAGFIEVNKSNEWVKLIPSSLLLYTFLTASTGPYTLF